MPIPPPPPPILRAGTTLPVPESVSPLFTPVRVPVGLPLASLREIFTLSPINVPASVYMPHLPLNLSPSAFRSTWSY